MKTVINCRVIFPLLILLWSGNASGQSNAIDCLQADQALAYWRPIRESVRDKQHDANVLAAELLGCLGSPNSELRDRIAYELFTYWLRNDAFSLQAKKNLYQSLLTNVQEAGNEHTLRRSFSALILGELMRADNLSTFLSDNERLQLLEVTVSALERESDFRGLVEDIGWVHPIAHMADILWRFTLHAAITREESVYVLQGVRAKAGASAAAYAFNEGDRLARPVSVLIAREVLTPAEIVSWLSSFEAPTTMDNWFDAFGSIEGMHELHNSKLFIRALADQLQGESINNEIREKIDELVLLLTAIV